MKSFALRLLDGCAKFLPSVLTARLMEAIIFERAIWVLDDAHLASVVLRVEIALFQNPARSPIVIAAGADRDFTPLQKFLNSLRSDRSTLPGFLNGGFALGNSVCKRFEL